MSEEVTLDDFADNSHSNGTQTDLTELRVGPFEFSLPPEWDTASLSDACENKDGDRVPVKKSKRESMNGKIPYYGASGQIDSVDDFLFDERLLLLAEDGANLLTRSRPIAYIIEGKSWVNNHAHVLKPYEGHDIHYLAEFLEFIDYEPFVTGTAQPKLTQNSMGFLRVPKPPILEQRKTATVLYTFNQAIEKTEAVIEQAKKTKQGLVKEIVTGGIDAEEYKTMRVGPHEFEIPNHWGVESISESSENLDSERIPVNKSNREDMQGEIPYYGASGCVDYVDDYLFNEPLILLAEDGENLRSRTQRVAFKITGKSWVNNHAHVLRPKDEFEIDYLVEYLERLDYRPYVSGSAQPKLNQTMLNKITVPKPPLEEQKEIASILNEFKNQILHEAEYLDQLTRLKRGLMQDLLLGTVRTTDTNIEVPDEIVQYG